MKKKLVLCLSFSVLAIWALTCAAAPVAVPTPGAGITETVNAGSDTVYDAFVKYFADNGYVLDSADKPAGTITTIRMEVTDKEVVSYYRNVTGDKSEYKTKGLNFGYCDCGLPQKGRLIWQNLYYSYTVDIKKVTDKTTQVTVKARFWTELYKQLAFALVEYDSDRDCVSTGEYEKKLIEEIKAKYLK
ncbi:MAG: hypothetical protein JW765_09995 [Deltaproteobacteria bacterium]|nr:hypothetical protein [Candidatus Zymogenaceae bacterium]